MIVTLTARCQALLKMVVKLKTYMLILNCCINVLSHRNRLSIEQLFLLNISGAESKNEALAVQNRSRQLFRLFHTFSNVMSRNLLVPYPDRAKAIKKKQKILQKLKLFSIAHFEWMSLHDEKPNF